MTSPATVPPLRHPMRSVSAVFGTAAQVFEAPGQRRHGRLGAQVVGEVDEADPAPGHHGAEDEQRTDLAPVEDQHVARRPDAGRRPRWFLRPPLGLDLGHQPAQVASRSLVAGGLGHRQEPLGRIFPLVRSTRSATRSLTAS